jgi:hypothetical protein
MSLNAVIKSVHAYYIVQTCSFKSQSSIDFTVVTCTEVVLRFKPLYRFLFMVTKHHLQTINHLYSSKCNAYFKNLFLSQHLCSVGYTLLCS